MNSDIVENNGLSSCKGSRKIHFDKNGSDRGRFTLICCDDASRLILLYYNFPWAEFCWDLAHSYRKLRYLRRHVETIYSVLRKTFGPKWEEVTGGCRKLHKEKFRVVSLSPNITRIILSGRMRWTGHVAWCYCRPYLSSFYRDIPHSRYVPSVTLRFQHAAHW